MGLRKLTIILGIGLFFSLSANMFLAGMLMGRSVSGQTETSATPSSSARLAKKDKELRQNLSADDQQAVKAAMESSREKFRTLREELKTAQENVRLATNAEPFDQAALDEALRAEKEKKMEILSAMRQTRKNVMQNLSPEGQKALQRFGQSGSGRFSGRLQQRDGADTGQGRPFLRNRPAVQSPAPQTAPDTQDAPPSP